MINQTIAITGQNNINKTSLFNQFILQGGSIVRGDSDCVGAHFHWKQEYLVLDVSEIGINDISSMDSVLFVLSGQISKREELIAKRVKQWNCPVVVIVNQYDVSKELMSWISGLGFNDTMEVDFSLDTVITKVMNHITGEAVEPILIDSVNKTEDAKLNDSQTKDETLSLETDDKIDIQPLKPLDKLWETFTDSLIEFSPFTPLLYEETKMIKSLELDGVDVDFMSYQDSDVEAIGDEFEIKLKELGDKLVGSDKHMVHIGMVLNGIVAMALLCLVAAIAVLIKIVLFG